VIKGVGRKTSPGLPIAPPDAAKLLSIRGMPRLSAEIAGLELTFETSLELFSSRNIDPGTAAMLRCVNIEPQDKVLNLGCGYGVVDIYAAHRTVPTSVWLVDVDPVA
jgi:16S rRNA (guanine1207-N2)-methyltransferase